LRLLRADALLRLLKQSRMENSREAGMTELATLDVLIIDDFALEPMTRAESRDITSSSSSATRAAPPSFQQPRPGQVDRPVFHDALLAQTAVDRFGPYRASGFAQPNQSSTTWARRPCSWPRRLIERAKTIDNLHQGT
jgi:hypothetical protein